MQTSGASRCGVAKSYLEFHVIASEAKQSISPRKGRMDCFVASLLAMTVYKLNYPWLFENEAKVSVRLLPQLRVRTAEVGGGGVLADLDDAAADGAGGGE